MLEISFFACIANISIICGKIYANFNTSYLPETLIHRSQCCQHFFSHFFSKVISITNKGRLRKCLARQIHGLQVLRNHKQGLEYFFNSQKDLIISGQKKIVSNIG
ncbi:hypothetical protein AMTRI_Chr01g136720 [Amborella trichopoda]